jgi:integrase
VPRRRFQTGCFRIVGNQWCLYFWRDEIRDGERVRVKVSKRIGKATAADRALLLEDDGYVPRGIRRDAQPILDAANKQTEIPIRDSKRSITFAEFIPEWRRLAAPSLKPSTLKGMESVIRAHLIPALGDVPLTNLDVRRVQELITSLVDKTAKGTRENIFGDLQTVLKAARKWHNNIPVVKRDDLYFGVKKAGEGRKTFLTVPQVRAILKEVKGRKPWDAFFWLLSLSGLRSAEILGLYVEDLDFDNNLIWIRRGAWNGEIQTVKTPESETSIPMTPIVKVKLRAHLVGHTHHLLFPNKIGRPFNRGRVVKKIFHPILDRLGIPRKGRRVGFHAFRHTLASMLLQSTGVMVAQRQMRHSDATFTVENYGHILGNDHTDAMDQIESVLLGPSGS